MRWLLLGGLALVALVLGYLGFRDYFDGVGVAKSTTDLFYVSLQLFVLESGSIPETGAPWQLEVARLAAPAVSATAVVSTLVVFFREELAGWRIRRLRGHVVICGLGDSGARLAGELRAAGHQVVGIEHNGATPALEALRRQGIAVIIGDGRDRETLERAHLERAGHLVALTGADDTNADVIIEAAELVEDRPGAALICLAQIRDPDLCMLLRSDELAAAHRRGSRLDFFNIDEQGARAMIHDHPPFPLDDGEPPEVMVVGLNRLGQSLVAELARQWRSHPAAAGRRMTITVVDPEASEIVDRLHRRYPLLAHAADVTPITAALDPLDPRAVGASAARLAYVCIDNGSVAVQAALRIPKALTDPDAVVVTELLQGRGMARLMDRPAELAHLRPFDVPDRVMRADLLLGGTYELIAQAIHEDYLEEQRRQGATAATNPAMMPWEQLPASLKESNRDQASHIGTKLAAIGSGIAPLTDWAADAITFSDAEVEMLAEMEHQRWVDQRRLDGWTPGEKDIETKTTPYLVPWDMLSDEVKELDRQTVRGLPAFLAHAGYQIISAG